MYVCIVLHAQVLISDILTYIMYIQAKHACILMCEQAKHTYIHTHMHTHKKRDAYNHILFLNLTKYIIMHIIYMQTYMYTFIHTQLLNPDWALIHNTYIQRGTYKHILFLNLTKYIIMYIIYMQAYMYTCIHSYIHSF